MDGAGCGHPHVTVQLPQHHIHTASFMHKLPDVVTHRHRALLGGARVRWTEAVAFQEGTEGNVIPSIEIHCQHPGKNIGRHENFFYELCNHCFVNLRINILGSNFKILV